MTALELILLELILVPAPGSQFACVHNNETRAALAAVHRAQGLRLSIEGVEASKAKPTTITMVSGSQTFNTGPSMGRLSCFSIAVSSVRVMKFNYCPRSFFPLFSSFFLFLSFFFSTLVSKLWGGQEQPDAVSVSAMGGKSV